ncbi:MAG: serine/threonine protein kinase [Chloroflexi bacterium]|nr:serine/threonine protein kinase [Chloroflexota bacterium]
MSFSIGQTVGQYKIVAQLGQGGMATVYKAYHPNLDRHVAIKVMHIAFSEDESFLERFKREAQIVTKLDHPHIVPIYDYADYEGQPYLVMKFVEGFTLKQRMRKNPPDLQEVTLILDAVAQALDYAHQQDVLHRDVKPSNIVIDRSGTPYLTDFGLARVASAGESTLSHDMMLGTPQYISPEQAQGRRDLNAGTDIYSLGVVLYELVVGRVPFTSDTAYSIIHDHIYKPLPQPSEMNPAVPREVEGVLAKALAKPREDRYRTAGELAAAFKNALGQSHMQEISLNTLRPEAFNDEPIVTPPSDAGVRQEAAMSAQRQSRLNEAVGYNQPLGTAPDMPFGTPTPQTGSTPMTPPPGSILVPGSSVNQRTRGTGMGWALSGCLLFIVICIVSVGIMGSIAEDPKFSEEFVAEGAEPESQAIDQEILEAAREGILTTELAEAYTEEYPEEPTAFFALALTQLENDNRPEAQETMRSIFEGFSVTAAELASWAEIFSDRGLDNEAIWLYLTALIRSEDDSEIRSEASQYIYIQASTADRGELETFCVLTREFDENAFAKAMYAQAIVSVFPNPEGIGARRMVRMCFEESIEEVSTEDLILESIESNTPLPEGYLVLGNYYEKTELYEEARESWELIADLPEVPEWITVRAREQIDNLPQPTTDVRSQEGAPADSVGDNSDSAEGGADSVDVTDD